MFLFSLGWSQGWVGFTCTDSCSETLRLLYVFSCACFSLYIIGNCFIYHSCCNRFIWIVYFICICGRKLIPSSRCIPSIHQGAQPPISFLPGWMSTSYLCVCSLQWIFCIPNLHCIPWCFLNCSFTQCDDLWIYIYCWRWPTFKFQSLIQN